MKKLVVGEVEVEAEICISARGEMDHAALYSDMREALPFTTKYDVTYFKRGYRVGREIRGNTGIEMLVFLILKPGRDSIEDVARGVLQSFPPRAKSLETKYPIDTYYRRLKLIRDSRFRGTRCTKCRQELNDFGWCWQRTCPRYHEQRDARYVHNFTAGDGYETAWTHRAPTPIHI